MTKINKYNKAKIYRIVSNITGENYYGSTCEPTLARRLAKHRSNYNDYVKGKYSYVTSFKILETDDYEIVLVENVNCNNKEELHQRERYHIENNICVNKFVPNRTKKQYYEDKKHKLLEQQKHRYEDNKDKILEQQKQYREDNKDKIKVRVSQQYNCECGRIVRYDKKSRHLKSKIHLLLIKNIN